MPASPDEQAKKHARLEHAGLEFLAKERKLDDQEYSMLALWCDLLQCDRERDETKWCQRARLRHGMAKIGMGFDIDESA